MENSNNQNKGSKKQKITGDMAIGDIVTEYPIAGEVLIEAGIHCVGCGAAFHETLHDGLAGHGMSEEEIIELIKKLNEAVE